MKKYRDEPSTSRTPDMSHSSTTMTAGGLKFGYEPQQSQSSSQQPTGLVINTNAVHHSLKVESPPSSPGSEASARKRRKGTNSSITPQQSPHGFVNELKKERDEKDPKSTPVLQNGTIGGGVTHHHMLGNTLNPASNVAKNMSETLTMEIEAHSIYTSDPQPNFTGPQYPGRKDSVRSCKYWN